MGTEVFCTTKDIEKNFREEVAFETSVEFKLKSLKEIPGECV